MNAKLLHTGLSGITNYNDIGSYDNRYPYLSYNEVSAKNKQIAQKYGAQSISSISEIENTPFGQKYGINPAGTKARANSELQDWVVSTNSQREQREITAKQAAASIAANNSQKSATDAKLLIDLTAAGLINKSDAVNQAGVLLQKQAASNATDSQTTAPKSNTMLYVGIGLGLVTIAAIAVVALK